MGVWGWIALLVAAAAVATAAQVLVGLTHRTTAGEDWVYLAGGALVGGFTGHAWYAGVGPVFDGLALVPAAVGLVVGAVALEGVHRMLLRGPST